MDIMNKTSAADVPPIVELSVREPLLSFITDSNLALAVPIVAYWIYSTIFHIIDTYNLLPQYRIHPLNSGDKVNKVSFYHVIRDVIFQQIVQTITGLIVAKFETPEYVGMEARDLWLLHRRFPFLPSFTVSLVYYVLEPAVRIFLAFCVVDTWQYFIHRAAHQNAFLYRNFHSRHHRLYVVYAFGALYNHPLEGLVLDTAGAGLGMYLTGLSTRESLIFYTFSTLKTVDDHCGYVLPWDPLQTLFQNYSAFHDIHHQPWGIKKNFSQPFFIVWDKILGTQYEGPRGYKKSKDGTVKYVNKEE